MISPFTPGCRWILPPQAERVVVSGSNEWFAFRAKLQIGEAESVATLQIAADSKYWLYLNGRLLIQEGGLKRGPTPDGSYFDIVNLSGYLQQGKHTLAVLLWHFGRQAFSHRDSGKPALLVDAQGGEVGGWRVKRHTAYFDAGYVAEAYRLAENSVGFDARLDMGPWTQPDFDDSRWPLAEVAGEPGDAPWGGLEPREFAQWTWSEARSYVSVEETLNVADSSFREVLCRLPHSCHFIPILKIEADEEGLKIDIVPALSTNCLQATYVTKSGRQIYESIGWMSGEEVIYRFPAKGIRVISLGYRATGYPADFKGSFSCDAEDLNTLWEKARRTLYVTMRDTFMDCPCRERAQWPGDMVIQLGQVPYCLGRSADFLTKKGLRETFRWQREDGVLYGPVPEGNWRMELPAQMLSIVSPYGLWTYYLHTGDMATLKECFPAAKRYLDIWDFLPNGLIKYRPDKKGEIPCIVDGISQGTWDWIDWGDRIDAEPALNAWYILAVSGVRLMAEALGLHSIAVDLAEREQRMQSAFRDAFWDESRGGFVSKEFSSDPDDRAQALAVLCGAAKPEHYAALLQVFECVEQACPYMEKYVIEALFSIGRSEAALCRMQRRYSDMVTDSHSTLSERWPINNKTNGTVNHSWSGGPLTLLSSVVAGIRPIEPGWKHLLVHPHPGHLKAINCSVCTPHGSVIFNATLHDGQWTVALTLPKGVTALVNLSQLNATALPFELYCEGKEHQFTLNSSRQDCGGYV